VLGVVRKAVLLTALGVIAGGCFEQVPFRELADWEIEIDGQRSPLHLPTNIEMLRDRPAVYTMRTHVELEPSWRGHEVTFGVPIMRTLMTLRVNGHPVQYLDEPLFDSLRRMSAHRFRIDAAATATDALDLELTIDHRIPESVSWGVAPRLALGSWGDARMRWVNAWNLGTAWVSFIALLTLATVFWMLHISARLRRANHTFDDKSHELSKLAVGSALYSSTQIGIFQSLIGRRDLGFIIIGILVSTHASIQLVRKYRRVPPLGRWAWWAIIATSLLIFRQEPPFSGRGWVYFAMGTLLLLVVWMLRETCGRRVNPENRAELWAMAALWVVITVFSTFDAARSLGYGVVAGGMEFICATLLLFVGAQAFLLATEYTNLIVEQQKLNRELGVRVDEVTHLNDELRRKVGDRSRELSAALRKLRVAGEGDLAAGTVLGEHYRVQGRLGAGAMGAVYRVERLNDGRSMAAKVVRGRLRPDTLERFTREAELAARVDHPNVVRVFDVDVTSDGELFLIMELIDGCSLEDLRDQFGDASFARAVVAQVAGALRAIHGAGIVHRDLKPSNVLVADGPRVKVADFGIAGFGAQQPMKISVDHAPRDLDEAALDETIDAPTGQPAAYSDPRLTATGAIMGTPLYMAPEVVQGTATIGPEVDLFSLGVIAYQLFGGPKIEREGLTFRKKSLATFASFAPSLEPALADALQRCLHQDPTRRPTAAQLVELFAESATRAVG
jgi:serine/threonine-protein kinase